MEVRVHDIGEYSNKDMLEFPERLPLNSVLYLNLAVDS
jgi:hypothetical protein